MTAILAKICPRDQFLAVFEPFGPNFRCQIARNRLRMPQNRVFGDFALNICGFSGMISVIRK